MRYLVVCDQTLGSDALTGALQERSGDRTTSFHVLVPPSHSPDAWIWSEGADHARAERHLKEALEDLRSKGLDVSGEVGDVNPLDAIGDVLRRDPLGFQEIVLCTPTSGLSRRVGRDLPHRIERTYSLPVHQVTAPLTRSYRGQEIPQPGTYAVDRANSSVAFVARFLMISKVRGRFSHFAGELHIAEVPEDSSVNITIDATSVNTDDWRRDAHLRSPDFLDVDRYPTLRFSSTSVELRGEAAWKVVGDLTFHGTTRPVALDVEFTGVAGADAGEHRAGFSASAVIDREEWGLTWNQPLDAGGVLIGKKVHIELDVQVVRTSI